MAEFHGKLGYVTLTTSTFNLTASLRQWQLRGRNDIVKTAILVTTGTQLNKNAYGGYTEYSGSFEGYVTSGSEADWNAMDGASATATFIQGDNTAIVGKIIFASMEITNAVDDVGKLSVSFEVDGNLN